MQYLGAISKMTECSLFVSKANHSISQSSKSVPQPVMVKKTEVEQFYEDLKDLLELTHTHTQRCPFIIGDWNEKVGS